MIVLANLDCEARWSGLGLPAHVARRISAAAALTAALVPAGEPVEIFAPAAVDPSRIRFASPTMRTGTPARWDLAWADPAARAANDRRFALAVAQELGCALPGARAIASLAELDAHLATACMPDWVVKVAWTAAGRDRARGQGAGVSGELRARIANLLRCGAAVVEPWLDRMLDFGACGTIAADGRVALHPPHVLRTLPHGGFIAIELAPAPALSPDERDRITAIAYGVADALTRAGYRGPFGIDGFVYRDGERRMLHPFCEINARHTFGHVARALGDIGALGFGAAPAGATLLIAPGQDDPFSAWCA